MNVMEEGEKKEADQNAGLLCWKTLETLVFLLIKCVMEEASLTLVPSTTAGSSWLRGRCGKIPQLPAPNASFFASALRVHHIYGMHVQIPPDGHAPAAKFLIERGKNPRLTDWLFFFFSFFFNSVYLFYWLTFMTYLPAPSCGFVSNR